LPVPGTVAFGRVGKLQLCGASGSELRSKQAACVRVRPQGKGSFSRWEQEDSCCHRRGGQRGRSLVNLHVWRTQVAAFLVGFVSWFHLRARLPGTPSRRQNSTNRTPKSTGR
ncbi:unnamed protein product, partial [Scytosiphon promiscuus]